jgi:hypothetical protein
MWTALLTGINHCYSPNHLHNTFFLKIELLHSNNYCNNFWKSPLLKILCDYHNMVLYISIRFNDTKYKIHFSIVYHLTSSTRISPSCSNISVGISWINFKDQCTWSVLNNTVEFRSNHCTSVTVTHLTKFLFRHLAWKTMTMLKFHQTWLLAGWFCPCMEWNLWQWYAAGVKFKCLHMVGRNLAGIAIYKQVSQFRPFISTCPWPVKTTKFQHVRYPPWPVTDELIEILQYFCCISVEKLWNISWLGASNQQPDLAIVTSVGIFDNLR